MAASDFHLFEVIPVESERVRGITTKAILTEDENNALRWKSSTGNVSNPLSFDRPVQEVISTRTDDSVFVFTDKQGSFRNSMTYNKKIKDSSSLLVTSIQ